jgi:tRNA(fMet)-specific endonuclease VapC
MTDLRYLLDTNVASDIARHPNGLAAHASSRFGVEYAGISIVGRVRDPLRRREEGAHWVVDRLTQVLAQCETLSLEPPVDEHYADIRNRLERAGRSIGPNDLLIAAHARPGLDARHRQPARVFPSTGPCGRALAGGGCLNTSTLRSPASNSSLRWVGR